MKIDKRIIDDIETLVLTVKDNGVGRKEAARLDCNSTKQGLRILLEQINIYNQTNQRQIRQQITDLFNDDNSPAGTSFQMFIPTDYHYE